MAAATRTRDSRGAKLLPLVAAVALPYAVFVIHGTYFRGWLIDDAGISFAYARHLAAGYGLVAQPGAAPVEGFTNLLWVVLLAPFTRFGDSPGTAALLLAHVFVLASFATLAAGVRSWCPRRWLPVTAVGLTATSLATGFTAWTLSGLENALLAALIAALPVAATSSSDSRRAGLGTGLLWILLFATRPDTAPLALVPPAAWALRGHERTWRAYAAVAAAGLLSVTLFRALYFGDVVPNTYYAKGAVASALLGSIDWTPLAAFSFAAAGSLALAAAIAAVHAGVRRFAGGAESSMARAGRLTLWLTLLVCYATFEAMPSDWMPEGRFATALLLLAPVAVLSLPRRRLPLAVAAMVLLAGGGAWAALRTPDFARRPPAPFGSVIELSHRLAAVGDALGSGASTRVLLPDIGGALWENRFEVVDLGGLIDPEIGRALGRGDIARLHDHLFERREPDLIWVHGFWRAEARLETDPRLDRDYEPLHSDGAHVLYVRRARPDGIASETLIGAFRGGG